jgi:hypothetical protein
MPIPSSLIYNIDYSARTTTSVTVNWKSTIPLTSRVLYGTTSVSSPSSYPNYGYQNSTVEDTQLRTTHSVTITGLLPSTTYYFRPVGHI